MSGDENFSKVCVILFNTIGFSYNYGMGTTTTIQLY